MGDGLLAAVLARECQQLVPTPPGPQLSYLGLATLLLTVFLGGCCCGAAALGGLIGFWWQGRAQSAILSLEPVPAKGGGDHRLDGYRRR